MKWITQKYVRQEAKKGRKKAIECVRLHWHQLYTATEEETAYILRISQNILKSTYCALCYRYYTNNTKCLKCPLQCKNEWWKASINFSDWKYCRTSENWRKWKQVAKAMLDKIDRLYKRLYGSKT